MTDNLETTELAASLNTCWRADWPLARTVYGKVCSVVQSQSELAQRPLFDLINVAVRRPGAR